VKYYFRLGQIRGVDKWSSKNCIENIRLPHDVYISNASFCKVVQVSYELQVEISDAVIKFPITISLLPILKAPASDHPPSHNSTEVSDYPTFMSYPPAPPEIPQESADVSTDEPRKFAGSWQY
jgi:hypothetical protein